MKTKLYSLVGILILISYYGCRAPQEKGVEIVTINFDQVKTVDVSQGEIIKLETTESSLLYEINNIDIFDSKMIIQTRGKSIAFSLSGDYLFQVGTKGEGPNEYKGHRALFIKDSLIHLFDDRSRKVLKYDFDGAFISTVGVTENTDGLFPSALLPLHNGYSISKNTFQGVEGRTPTLSILRVC